MTTLNEHVLNEAGERQDRLTIGQLVTLIERYDPEEGPGVTRERIREYAEALAERDAPVHPEKVDGAIDDRLTEEASLSGPVSWTGSTALFDVGEGRVSPFPREWHEAFPDRNASVHEIVEFALRDTEGGDAAANGEGAEGSGDAEVGEDIEAGEPGDASERTEGAGGPNTEAGDAAASAAGDGTSSDAATEAGSVEVESESADGEDVGTEDEDTVDAAEPDGTEDAAEPDVTEDDDSPADSDGDEAGDDESDDAQADGVDGDDAADKPDEHDADGEVTGDTDDDDVDTDTDDDDIDTDTDDDEVAARGDPDDDSAAMARDDGEADAGSDTDTSDIATPLEEVSSRDGETAAEIAERKDADEADEAGVTGGPDAEEDGPGERPADSGGAGSGEVADGPRGVPRQVVLNAATLFGGMEWSTAQGELESLRGEGVVVEDLDQHPNPNVRLATDEEETAADRVQE